MSQQVDAIVEAALAYATTIVRGPATEGDLAQGAFYRPSLLEVDDVSSDLVQKEVSAPSQPFEIFDTQGDTIRRANATEYGLAAGVFTNNINMFQS